MQFTNMRLTLAAVALAATLGGVAGAATMGGSEPTNPAPRVVELGQQVADADPLEPAPAPAEEAPAEPVAEPVAEAPDSEPAEAPATAPDGSTVEPVADNPTKPTKPGPGDPRKDPAASTPAPAASPVATPEPTPVPQCTDGETRPVPARWQPGRTTEGMPGEDTCVNGQWTRTTEPVDGKPLPQPEPAPVGPAE